MGRRDGLNLSLSVDKSLGLILKLGLDLGLCVDVLLDGLSIELLKDGLGLDGREVSYGRLGRRLHTWCGRGWSCPGGGGAWVEAVEQA